MENEWIIVPKISRRNQKGKFRKVVKEYYIIEVIDFV